MSAKNNQISKPALIRLLKLFVFALVVLMIGRTISRSLDDFSDFDLTAAKLNIPVLLIAGVLYTLGLFCFASVWHISLRILGQSPRFLESVASYFISQLGKYVPGKALVVIIRSERVRSERTALAPAVTAVFVETLAMMAVGALLASFIIIVTGIYKTNDVLLWISISLTGLAGIPSIPAVFRNVIRFITVRSTKYDSLGTNITNLTTKNMLPAWCLLCLGWLLLGASMYACIAALPIILFDVPLTLSDCGLVTASVALAMVAGFISLLPGGAGVREYIILSLLASNFGVVVATVSALLLRMTWLVAEMLFGVVFYILMKRSSTNKI